MPQFVKLRRRIERRQALSNEFRCRAVTDLLEAGAINLRWCISECPSDLNLSTEALRNPADHTFGSEGICLGIMATSSAMVLQCACAKPVSLRSHAEGVFRRDPRLRCVCCYHWPVCQQVTNVVSEAKISFNPSAAMGSGRSESSRRGRRQSKR